MSPIIFFFFLGLFWYYNLITSVFITKSSGAGKKANVVNISLYFNLNYSTHWQNAPSPLKVTASKQVTTHTNANPGIHGIHHQTGTATALAKPKHFNNQYLKTRNGKPTILLLASETDVMIYHIHILIYVYWMILSRSYLAITDKKTILHEISIVSSFVMKYFHKMCILFFLFSPPVGNIKLLFLDLLFSVILSVLLQ